MGTAEGSEGAARVRSPPDVMLALRARGGLKCSTGCLAFDLPNLSPSITVSNCQDNGTSFDWSLIVFCWCKGRDAYGPET